MTAPRLGSRAGLRPLLRSLLRAVPRTEGPAPATGDTVPDQK